MDILEAIDRRIEAALQTFAHPRQAIITAVDPVRHLAKGTVMPEGVETGWMQDHALAVAGMQIACPSQVGSQVVVMPIQGDEAGFAIVARHYDDTTPPPVSPITNQPAQPGECLMMNGSTVLHMLPGKIVLSVGASTLTISASGFAFSGAPLTNDHDVQANDVSLLAHIHSGVQAGAADTQKPVQ